MINNLLLKLRGEDELAVPFSLLLCLFILIKDCKHLGVVQLDIAYMARLFVFHNIYSPHGLEHNLDKVEARV